MQAERPRLTQFEGRNRLKPVLSRGVQLMSFGFLTDSHSPALWRGPLLAKALEDFFYEVHWGSLDILFIDLPPGTGDTQLTVIEKLPIHHALIVTTPQKLALADAVRAFPCFASSTSRFWLRFENRVFTIVRLADIKFSLQ